jgi:hypothetical protein
MSEIDGASAVLAAAAIEAMRPIPGLSGTFDGRPIQASAPFATVETGSETDWGHKSGVGREVRLTVVLHDEGERPTRLRELSAVVQVALESLAVSSGWRMVTFNFVRSMAVAKNVGGWALTLDYRARMLNE